MSKGGGGAPQSEQRSSSTSSSSSRPSTPQELLGYFAALDALTRPGASAAPMAAALAPQTTTRQVPTGPAGYSYGGQVYATRADAVRAADAADAARSGGPRLPSRYGLGNIAPVGGGYRTVTETTPRAGAVPAALAGGGAGRLAQWAQQGSAPVAYDASGIREVQYDALTPQQLRALGGAGSTRALAARRLREEQQARTAADPRLSIYQSSFQNQQDDRELAANQDAIAAEVEALLAQVMQQERGQDLAAQTTNQQADRETALRRLVAQQYNSQLTAQDLTKLADLFFRGMGSYSSAASSSDSYGMVRGEEDRGILAGILAGVAGGAAQPLGAAAGQAILGGMQ